MTDVLEKGSNLKKDLNLRNLAKRTGPRLSDGTLFRDLFDLDKREVSLRVMRDPEIHALEMTRIFGRSWLVVGHDSEIPNAGDFMIRQMGQDPVIVSRGKDGSVNVLLNACTHRGMEVCFADKGNNLTFKCPYHAWVYDADGSLLGVPFEKEMYGDGLDKSKYGLPRVRSTVRHGVIFANMSDTAPSLEDYLGDMLWYFDELYGNEEWMVVSSGGARNLVHANWKANLDQNHGDVLHTIGAHHDFAELGFFAEDFGQFTTKVHTPPRGHYLSLFEPDFGSADKQGGGGHEEEMEARKKLPLSQRGCVFLLYPTSQGFAGSLPRALPDGTKVRMANFGMHVPHGVDKFEFNGQSFMLVSKNTPPGIIAMMQAMGNGAGGLAGGQMEDNESWRSITNAARGPNTARKATMKYMAVGNPSPPEHWTGPGLVYDGFSMDDTQWHGWLHYFDIMTADEG